MKEMRGTTMYILQKYISAAEVPEEVVPPAKFTCKDICDFLMSIEELQGQKITAVGLVDGAYEFTIGDVVYTLIVD